MKKFLNEFKEFAMRGNVVDMAVGVVIGAAFKGIVDSLVNDVVSPFITVIANLVVGEALHAPDFNSMSFTLVGAQIQYGNFIMTVLNFFIMAFVIFLIVKGLNKLRGLGKPEEIAVPTTKICPFCKSKIALDATRCAYCTAELEAVYAETV